VPNRWVAVDAGIDPLSWARLLRRAYDRSVTGDVSDDAAPSTIVRPVIAASWARAEQAGVEIERRPSIMRDPADAARMLRQKPLRTVLSIVDNALSRVAEYAHQAVAVADAEGCILWVSGHGETCQAAARINLVPGASWSETDCGTNAVGTAIALHHPVQVFSAEHFKRVLHGWSAAAAPIRDPATGEILAVVALVGSFKRAHPHGFSLVVAASQIAEAQLRHDASERDERLKVEYLERVLSGCSEASAVVNPLGRVLLSSPVGWLGARLNLSPDGLPVAPVTDQVKVEPMRSGDGFLVTRERGQDGQSDRAVLHLEALGLERATGLLGRRSFEFTPRHSEILVILARHPQGLSDDELAAALYGSAIKNVTIRAEISRLRRLLGTVIRTRPYRLVADVRADFLDLLTALQHDGDAPDPPHPAPTLLPSSSAPAVLALRAEIERALAERRSGWDVASAAEFPTPAG
jgi:hypothetical protein